MDDIVELAKSVGRVEANTETILRRMDKIDLVQADIETRVYSLEAKRRMWRVIYGAVAAVFTGGWELLKGK